MSAVRIKPMGDKHFESLKILNARAIFFFMNLSDKEVEVLKRFIKEVCIFNVTDDLSVSELKNQLCNVDDCMFINEFPSARINFTLPPSKYYLDSKSKSVLVIFNNLCGVPFNLYIPCEAFDSNDAKKKYFEFLRVLINDSKERRLKEKLEKLNALKDELSREGVLL